MMKRSNGFRDYLFSNAPRLNLYSPEEKNELTLLIYKILQWAIRDEADVLTVTAESIIWKNDTLELGRFDIKDSRSLMMKGDLQTYFELVQGRDSIVASHLSLIEKTEGGMKFKII